MQNVIKGHRDDNDDENPKYDYVFYRPVCPKQQLEQKRG